MGWGSWSRKSQEAGVARGPLGIDLNAGRARAAHGKVGRNKLFALNDPHADLPLMISLDRRAPEMGRAALAQSRKVPHAICSGYLPHLGLPQEWKHGRQTLNAETALAFAFEQLRVACHGHEAVGLALPSYLTLQQVGRLLGIAENASLKVRGTATVPLALAAERATNFVHVQAPAVTDTPRNTRAVPATTIVVIDADEYAMTANVVRLMENEVRTISSAMYPRLGVRLWRERLLDALADRCVRQCRRDPRDNSETEQMLFDQIEDAVDRARTGQKVSLSVRSTHWYQDLVLSPVDLDACTAALCRQASDEVRALVGSLNEAMPPQAAWLTHDAGRLPGLAAALHQNMSERTSVRVLHPEAAAAAAANRAAPHSSRHHDPPPAPPGRPQRGTAPAI
jgi:hypothetical protein